MFVDVKFTDGRTIDTLRFDARSDTPETVERLTQRMKENGWRPIPEFRGGVKIVGPQIGGYRFPRILGHR